MHLKDISSVGVSCEVQKIHICAAELLTDDHVTYRAETILDENILRFFHARDANDREFLAI
jgi:hypothetical protein